MDQSTLFEKDKEPYCISNSFLKEHFLCIDRVCLSLEAIEIIEETYLHIFSSIVAYDDNQCEKALYIRLPAHKGLGFILDAKGHN